MLAKQNIAISVFVLLLVGGASAQEVAVRATPALPVLTSGFCVNKVTGVMRLALEKNGVASSCHPNEIGVSLDTLETLGPPASPVPNPGPSSAPSPAPSAVPSPAPSAQPSIGTTTGPLTVVDANGTALGTLFSPNGIADGFETQNATAVMTVGGELVAPNVTAAGFANSTTDDPSATTMTTYYTSSDCSTAPLLAIVLADVSPGQTAPSVQPLLAYAGGVYVYVPPSGPQTMYYAQAPFSTYVIGSEITSSPTGQSTITGTCIAVPSSNNEELIGGPLAITTINFTPPFSIKQ
jgi:hypothetical protein